VPQSGTGQCENKIRFPIHEAISPPLIVRRYAGLSNPVRRLRAMLPDPTLPQPIRNTSSHGGRAAKLSAPEDQQN